jgi:hypothetical protein
VEVTETLSPPSAPVLLSPPDEHVTTTPAITLSWQASAGADGYHVDLDGEIVTTTQTYSPTVLALGVHTWTVRAYNAAGASDWAAVRSVEVTETLSPPSAPVLLSPPDEHVTTTQAITLSWQASAGADGYHVDLDGNTVTTTETFSPTVLALGIHTWTVQAYNAAGASDWAAVRSVEVTETQSPPSVPVLLSPPDGHITTTQAITLSWQASADADGYHVDLDGEIVTTTQTVSPTVLTFGVHTWTVRAYNATGVSEWADTWSVEISKHHIYLPLVVRNHGSGR